MARTAAVAVGGSVFVCAVLYLWWVNRGIKRFPPELKGVLRKPWTTEEMRAMYQKVQDAPTDVRPFLYGKKGRRYIVSGGSGQVGGWIVSHLLLRGEDPAAIRIVDLTKPTRPEVAEKGVAFFATDVGDEAAVSKAFKAAWPLKVTKLPLTVFHTVAYMSPSDRKQDFMPIYDKVNINGTRHVLNAAKAAGAEYFIATSSGGAAIAPVNFWFPPWKSAPANMVQPVADVKIHEPDGRLSDYGSCYTYSKIVAENIVRKADDPKNGFRTGILRPGHVLYGHAVDTNASAVYQYLSRGGAPSWLHSIATCFGNGQNISVAHLAFENTLLNDPKSKLGGRIYHCSDPNPPVTFRELYNLLSLLAHPMKPCHFPEIPVVPIMLMAPFIEAYNLLRVRYLSFLPRMGSDIGLMQPALFQMSTIHVVYDNTAAARDIGYKPPISTLEGLCHQVLYFNRQVEARVEKAVAAGRGGEIEPDTTSSATKPPIAT